MTKPFKIEINHNFWKMIGAVAAVVTFSYAFYYDTNYNIEKNTHSIEKNTELINEMSKKVDDTYIFKGVSEGEIGSLKEQVKKIDEKQDMMIKMLAEYIISEK